MFGLFKKNKSFTAKLVDYDQEFVVEPGDSLLTGALKAGLPWPKKMSGWKLRYLQMQNY